MLNVESLEPRDLPAPLVSVTCLPTPPGFPPVCGYVITDDGTGGDHTVIVSGNHVHVDGVKYDLPDGWTVFVDPAYKVVGKK